MSIEQIALPRILDMVPPNVLQAPNTDMEMPAANVRQIGEIDRVSFQNFFNATIELVNETNMRQHEVDIAQINFATGRTNDILDVVMAQSRADSSLNFTVQMTNRIIEAYREIMRMQV